MRAGSVRPTRSTGRCCSSQFLSSYGQCLHGRTSPCPVGRDERPCGRLACTHARGRRALRQRPPATGRGDLCCARRAASHTDIKRFSNDCLWVQLQENCRQRDVYVVQPLVPPTQEHLVELLLMLDAARGASAASITAVIPHYAYARSDKKDASRISIAGRLVADMLDDRGREPGADDDAARAAGARVLLRPGRPPDRDRRAGRPLPRPRPVQHRRRLPRPRQRQDRDPVRAAARAAGRGRVEAAAGRRQGRDRRDRRRRARQAGDRPRRRDRHRRVDRRAARPARRAGLHERRDRLHARAVRGQGDAAAARPPERDRDRHDRHRPAARRASGRG